jgi:hypothetical protein
MHTGLNEPPSLTPRRGRRLALRFVPHWASPERIMTLSVIPRTGAFTMAQPLPHGLTRNPLYEASDGGLLLTEG